MIQLKAIREQKGLSQGTVAKMVGVSQPSYCNIENGKRTPCVKTAKRIGLALGFDWKILFE